MIVGPGGTNSLIAAYDEPMTIYSMDMPYATPIAFGVALGWPDKKVISLEGDGSMLAGLGVLSTIARYRPKNFTVIVLDNERYLATGTGQSPTATASGTSIEQVGRAVGLTQSVSVSDLNVAQEVVDRALVQDGPWLIVAKVDKSDYATPRYRPVDVFESGLRFRRAILQERGTN